MTLTLDIPTGASREKMERLAVALYDAQAMTQSQAAEMAGMSRAEFLDALGRAGVSPFQYDANEAIMEARRR